MWGSGRVPSVVSAPFCRAVDTPLEHWGRRTRPTPACRRAELASSALLHGRQTLGRGLGGCHVVVDVRLLGVLLLLLVPAIVVAVRQRGVIVLVGVPVRAVLPLHKATGVVVGHVVVIVAVRQ